MNTLVKVGKNKAAKKVLRNYEDKPILEAPLQKKFAQKAARQVNYKETREVVTKYDPIVKENRQADQLVFPRDQEKVSFKIADQFATSTASSSTTVNGALAPETKNLKGLEKEISEQLMLSEENVEFDSRVCFFSGFDIFCSNVLFI